MTVVHRGLAAIKRLVRQTGGVISYNRDGTVSAVEKYRCLYTSAIALAPKRNITSHPVFPDLTCKECSITEIPGGIAEITAIYIGAPSPGGSLTENGPDAVPNYSLNCEVSQEPIETFPGFATGIGSVSNGAKFDANNLFLGFSKISPYVGISAWLVPGQIWKEEGHTQQPPESRHLARVGKIDQPTGDIGTPAGRNWLLRAYNWRQEGKIYPYVKEWQLSGPSGWNDAIYGVAPS